MHIHNASLNQASQSAQPSAASLASRRASETRQKLSASASELEAASSMVDPWAVSMAGSFGGSSQGSDSDSSQHTGETRDAAHRAGEEIPSTSELGPVSYWA
jgi:hypothetical protein